MRVPRMIEDLWFSIWGFLVRLGILVGLFGGGGAAIYYGASYGPGDWRCLTLAAVSVVCFFIVARPDGNGR